MALGRAELRVGSALVAFAVRAWTRGLVEAMSAKSSIDWISRAVTTTFGSRRRLVLRR